MSNVVVKNSASARGIGFFGLLGIVFIVLKLCHVIEWSWVWVLAPIWGSVALGVLLIIVAFVIFAIGTREQKHTYKKK